MKKKVLIIISIVILLIFILLLLNLKKFNSNIKKTDSSNTIVVTMNSGVPYSWEYNLSDESIVSINKTSKVLSDNDGGPIEVYFNVIPKKEGTTFLTLNYTSILDNEIIETKKHKIEINKDLEVKINIDVEEKINNIVSNGPLTSSNPFDYVKASREEYDELLKYPKETFEYAIKDLIETEANKGLKSYIEALLCSEINKNFKYEFESANDFLKNYKEFLNKSYSDLNEYDKYALSLIN